MGHGQMCFLSPVCILLWRAKCPDVVKDREQILHTCVFLESWTKGSCDPCGTHACAGSSADACAFPAWYGGEKRPPDGGGVRIPVLAMAISGAGTVTYGCAYVKWYSGFGAGKLGLRKQGELLVGDGKGGGFIRSCDIIYPVLFGGPTVGCNDGIEVINSVKDGSLMFEGVVESNIVT